MTISAIIQYEVLVFENGRWHVHARYPREERERAIEEASLTDASMHRPTKVVRDSYDPETGVNDESTIYISPKARRPSAPPTLAERQAMAVQKLRSLRRRRARRRQAAHRQQSGGLSPLARLLASFSIGCLVALVATGFLSWPLSNGSGLSATTLSLVLLTACLGAFLLTFLALIRKGNGWRYPQRERSDPAE